MAEEWLGVAQLLSPEELVNPNVDELSMMTYLAQFREAKMKESTGETPKQQLLSWVQDLLPGFTNFRKGWEDGRQVGALVDATAPGLCPGWEEWRDEDKVRWQLIEKHEILFLSKEYSLGEKCKAGNVLSRAMAWGGSTSNTRAACQP